MSSRGHRLLLIPSLLLSLACGSSAATAEVAEEEIVNVDSLLDVMAERYDRLCAERKIAYSEGDLEVRRQLLEQNDRECRALQDSLGWVMSYREQGDKTVK